MFSPAHRSSLMITSRERISTLTIKSCGRRCEFNPIFFFFFFFKKNSLLIIFLLYFLQRLKQDFTFEYQHLEDQDLPWKKKKKRRNFAPHDLSSSDSLLRVCFVSVSSFFMFSCLCFFLVSEWLPNVLFFPLCCVLCVKSLRMCVCVFVCGDVYLPKTVVWIEIFCCCISSCNFQSSKIYIMKNNWYLQHVTFIIIDMIIDTITAVFPRRLRFSCALIWSVCW